VKKTVTPATWEEFRKAGLLWFVNRMLHVFGWSIVVEVDVEDTDGPVSKCYPARVRFRGFDPDSESEGFIKLTDHMKEEMDRLVEEVRE